VVHLYNYDNFDERDAARRAAAQDKQWQEEYLNYSRQYVSNQTSSSYVPATGILDACGALPIMSFAHNLSEPNTGPGMYELLQYQLRPGYETMPKLLESFQKAITVPEGKLVFLGHSDVGMLNSVLELWRYPSAASCINARTAAGRVPAWKEAIEAMNHGIQSCQSCFLRPVTFSPLQ